MATNIFGPDIVGSSNIYKYKMSKNPGRFVFDCISIQILAHVCLRSPQQIQMNGKTSIQRHARSYLVEE